MDKGKIQQAGTKEALVIRPANEFVRSFLGVKGLLSMLDPKRLGDVYADILNKRASIEDIYEQLSNIDGKKNVSTMC